MKDNTTDVSGTSGGGFFAVSIADRIAGSDSFLSLFSGGMKLLELTADYLDGPGREESKALSRLGGLAYATESMKLTTRLMQIASWLLLQRAVNDGEMSAAQAAEEKSKVRLSQPDNGTRSTDFDELPDGLKDLIERSLRLQARIHHLDRLLRGEPPARSRGEEHPVFAQFDRVRAAFGTTDA